LAHLVQTVGEKETNWQFSLFYFGLFRLLGTCFQLNKYP